MGAVAIASPVVSIMDDEPEIVAGLLRIALPEARVVADVTYGAGRFWREQQPTFGFDRDPNRALSCVADFTCLPLSDKSVDAVVFDPPFHPVAGNAGVIGAHYGRIDGGVAGLRRAVEAGLSESVRVSRVGVLVKLQDYIHDHKPVRMVSWARELLGEPYDVVHRRMPFKRRAPNWSRQLSVYSVHSTFLCYRFLRSLR